MLFVLSGLSHSGRAEYSTAMLMIVKDVQIVEKYQFALEADTLVHPLCAVSEMSHGFAGPVSTAVPSPRFHCHADSSGRMENVTAFVPQAAVES